MFEYVPLKQSSSDFIKRLFYLKSYGKMQKYRRKTYVRGWQKLIAWTGNTAEPIADSSIHQLKNPPSPQSSKIPQKSSKISNFQSQTSYRTPYR